MAAWVKNQVVPRPAHIDARDAQPRGFRQGWYCREHGRQSNELRPEPLAVVASEDPGLGGNSVEMWSYPVIQDGLIYVVDVRNGLYVLRYHGPWSDQVGAESFVEGNSNL